MNGLAGVRKEGLINMNNGIIKGVFYQINVDELGEFKFLFSENMDIQRGEKKYFLESFWNPPNYGLVDFIVGYYVEDIEKEMNRIKEDMNYFIDGARVSCLCRIEDGTDTEGVYEGILYKYFGEEINDCDEDAEDNEDIDIEKYLYTFNKDDLIELINKLDIKSDNINNLSDEDDLINKIIISEDEDIIIEVCEDLFGYSYDDFIIDNQWRNSDYESKDIGDWDVDDHLAAWYDHMMEK